ncbi:hypothetical protein L1D15_13430, partial [Vibrio sp. Isolate25]|uniref:hypothetical protein n=1 Tax=Vibrio sp. Isolate25 TaxID=2908535 RepID=UPI001EFD3A7D
ELGNINRVFFKEVGKEVLNRHKKSETYKQISDCLSSEGSVNRSLSDLHCSHCEAFLLDQETDANSLLDRSVLVDLLI